MYDPCLEADNLGITVHKAMLPRRVRGFYYRAFGFAIILLNRNMTETQKRCTLAHEIEHHRYSAASNIPKAFHCHSDKIDFCKHERMVSARAAINLVPPGSMARLEASENRIEAADIAEMFGITPEMARLRFEIYETKGY